MITHKVLEFPLIDLPLVLCTSNKGAIEGLIKLGMDKVQANEYVADIAPSNASGWAIIVRNNDDAAVCGIMCAKKRDCNTVAHEATHIAVMALDWAGIVYTADEHEILAMSVGWIVERHKESWK